jgi:hypothetical protein
MEAIKRPRAISISMPHELQEKIKAEAEKNARSISNMVVVILSRYFRATVKNEDGHAR